MSADKTLEQAQADLDSANPHVTWIRDSRMSPFEILDVQLERKIGERLTTWRGTFPPNADNAFTTIGSCSWASHYDHLGTGSAKETRSRGKTKPGQIHGGADTTTRPESPRCSVIAEMRLKAS